MRLLNSYALRPRCFAVRQCSARLRVHNEGAL